MLKKGGGRDGRRIYLTRSSQTNRDNKFHFQITNSLCFSVIHYTFLSFCIRININPRHYCQLTTIDVSLVCNASS